MSRRNRAQRVLAQPDPIYNSRLVTLLVSRILQSGKKSLAQRIVYRSLEIISDKTEENPNGVALASATEAGQLYNITTWSWDREAAGEPMASYELQNSGEVDALITQLKAIQI